MKQTCTNCIHFNVCEALADQVGRIDADLCDMFADKAKCVTLPCSVGDTIYTIIDDAENRTAWIDRGTVISFAVGKNGIDIYCRFESGLTYWFIPCDIGKTLFFDYAAAESIVCGHFERGKI